MRKIMGKRIRTSKELVDLLDNYLQIKNISRRQFSKFVNIPNTTISSWKTKNTLPSVELVAKIAEFMNVSLDYLVFDSDEIDLNKSQVTGLKILETVNSIDADLENIKKKIRLFMLGK